MRRPFKRFVAPFKIRKFNRIGKSKSSAFFLTTKKAANRYEINQAELQKWKRTAA